MFKIIFGRPVCEHFPDYEQLSNVFRGRLVETLVIGVQVSVKDTTGGEKKST